MASIIARVVEYVREQGKLSSGSVSVDEVAHALNLSRQQVVSARSAITRGYDDIYPCAPGAMVYEPGWKKSHPEDWAAAQERTRAISAGKAHTKATDKQIAARRRATLPNVMGPVTTIHNIVAVYVHPDHVAIQHEDGTYTELTGTVKLRTGGR